MIFFKFKKINKRVKKLCGKNSFIVPSSVDEKKIESTWKKMRGKNGIKMVSDEINSTSHFVLTLLTLEL
jgi:hypothetical protein